MALIHPQFNPVALDLGKLEVTLVWHYLFGGLWLGNVKK